MRVSSPKRERRHEQLLNAALKVFSRDGFDGASVADIADEAGVAKGSIYLYFDSKESLAGDLVQHVFTQDDGAARPGTVEKPLQHIVAFCEKQEERILALGEFSAIVLHMWGQAGKSASSHIARGVRQIFNESAFYIETLLENAQRIGEVPRTVKPGPTGRAVLALCYGLIQHRITFDKNAPSPAESCGDAVRVYLRGLGART
ncbi:MAG: TetR/AcrR family transcriptional regulator [Planctomycetes bacterium]|nr:TetR/AcrR family transcriptional regulator [Planctomycetota bacterium]